MNIVSDFLRRRRGKLLLLVLLMLLEVGAGLMIPTMTATLINSGLAGTNLSAILLAGSRMALASLLAGLGALAGSYLTAALAAELGRYLRDRLYDHTLAFSDSDMERFGTSTLITRTLSDVNVVQQAFVMLVLMVLPVPAVCLLCIGLSFYLDAAMGWLMLGMTLVLMPLMLFVLRRAAPCFTRLQSLLDRMNTVVREAVTGVRVIRAFNKEDSEEARLEQVFRDYRGTAVRVNRLFAGMESTALLLINIMLVAILWLCGERTGSGAMEIGDIAAVSQYAVLILFFLMMAQMVLVMLPRAGVCLGRLREVLDRRPGISDPEVGGPPPETQHSGAAGTEAARASIEESSSVESAAAPELTRPGSQTADGKAPVAEHRSESAAPADAERRLEAAAWSPSSCASAARISSAPASPTPSLAVSAELATEAASETVGETAAESPEEPPVMSLRSVSFRYPDADEDTLHDINLSCRRGQTTAIIGSTGCGKSTVAKLMLRLLDPTQGCVTLHGTDIRRLRQADLRARIADVPQRAWLFSGSIADNLRYGCPDATEEQMRAALHLAQAHFVDELPDGLHTRVARGGSNFSGGQKQRLCIARALIKPADLYLFDDSFSALDFRTDAALRRGLSRALQQSALLVIAQRVSTIAHADCIIVLEDGRVVGCGRHQELIDHCPVYRDIVHSQMKRER